MPFPTTKLKVLPNPWTYIDHNGQPAGRLPFDGYEHSPGPGAVGASITDVKLVQKAMVMRVAGADLEVNPAQHDHRITYSKDPVSIPNTKYYIDALRRGDLVAADKETALIAGLKFEDPTKVLAVLKAAAVKAFDAETAENAYARFGSVEPLYTESEVSTTPAPAAQAAPAKVEAK